MIDCTVPLAGLIKAQVVFPSTAAALIPRPLGHVSGCALLRIANGTVWMLRVPGTAWTRNRLLSAAKALAGISDNGARGFAERALRRLPGLGGITVDMPNLDGPDPSQWDVQGIAAALVARTRTLAGARDALSLTAAQTRSAESALRGELHAALQEFIAGMDAMTYAAASVDGSFDVTLYNYLVCEPFRTFRAQFAATFPSLLHTTVAGAPGTLGAELRAIVNQGRPVVKGLAARWGVRPGVVRHLVGRSSALVGAGWTSKPRELALLLNAMLPEDVPGDAPQAWEQFNHAVAIGQELFRKPVWQSQAALEWLRESIHRVGRRSREAHLRWLPDPETLKAIGRFRDALAGCLSREAVGATVALVQSLSVASDEVIDGFLSRSAHRGLGAMAFAFESALADLVDELKEQKARASRIDSGTEMWPLIPGDFVSSDGTRVILPLTTFEELRTHGKALSNCLGRTHTYRYLRKGSGGATFIVGVFDASTDAPCSTAEIVLKRYRGTHTYDLAVAQHTAKENTDPSSRCVRAVAELLQHCRTPDIRRHLEVDWQVIARRGPWQGRRENDAEIHSMRRTALRRCLGDQTYDDLLAETLRHREQRTSE